MTLHIHTNWLNNGFLPKLVYGYDQQRIAYTLGVTWLRLAVFVTRHWDRNGCVYLGPIDRVRLYT